MRKIIGKENVFFLTGTDEHGQKIQRAAAELSLSPQEFSDKIVLQFRYLWKMLNISYDDFIRTTEDRHIKAVQRVLEILYEKGQIYSAKYEGWYCTPCETFWTQTQLTDQNCPGCKRPVEKISETNYFFKLSAHQDWLTEYIKAHPDFIRPQSRYHEALSFLELNKLTDLCISRPKERLSWGIPLPFSADHVTYVWFDALINYISAVGEFDAQGKYNSQWWPADLHLIGKDILRQHTVYWPIILHALDIELPKTVFAHGWWLIDQAKMSKSLGNAVSPVEMVEKFGIDAYRYFLLRDVPFGLDGNFSQEAMVKRFNSDLANDLGNIVYRTLTMVEKYFQGNIPQLDIDSIKYDNAGEEIKKRLLPVSAFLNKLDSDIAKNFNFSDALGNIWELINMVNKYIEDTRPWILAKEDKKDELAAFIRLLIEAIRGVAESIAPFMPQTSESIIQQLGDDKINKGKPLFPRIDIP